MLNNVIDINKVETKNNVVGDTKMKITKEITVSFQVHKELKKAEVEGIFHMEGVTFEVKRRTVYATKEVSSYSEEWNFQDLCKKWDFEEEAGSYIIETMEALYLKKCHAAAAEHERKYLIEEAERIAKLKEEETEEDFVGDTDMVDDSNVDDIVEVKEETKETGETTMQENNANNENNDNQEDNYFFSNGVFYYDWDHTQSVYIDCDNYPFHNGYHYEQLTEICGDNFFNSILQEKLKEYRLEYNVSDNSIVFKNVLEYDEQEFEETPGHMVLIETAQKIAKMFDGLPVEELFQMKKDNEDIFKNLINYHYDN